MYSLHWALNHQDIGGPFVVVGNLESLKFLWFALLSTENHNILWLEIKDLNGIQLKGWNWKG